MTVSYSAEVATSSFGCFLRLLFRWRGSIYKFVWKDFALFASLYCAISLVYRFLLDDAWKRRFEHLAAYCEEYNNLIPVAFILGFYVSIVVSRFWQQLNALPWPNAIAVFVSAMIHDDQQDAEIGRVLRRTIMRYLSIAYVLTMRDICPPVRKRFPRLSRITDTGLMTKEEEKILKEISRKDRRYNIRWKKFKDLIMGCQESSDQENVYYVPLMWAIHLVNKAYHEHGLIRSDGELRMLVSEINNYRGQCGTLFNFDWISVPLVYTQVVTIAVYTFFVACLFGRQALDNHEGDMYFPVFTFLQFLFYMGWLKVAECLHNPFGGDDDDFEINPLIEENLQMAFTIVDELCDFSPRLERDAFFNTLDVDIPYNPRSEKYRRVDTIERSAVIVDARKKKRPKKTHFISGDDEDLIITKRVALAAHRQTTSGSDGTKEADRPQGMSTSDTRTTTFSEPLSSPERERLMPDDEGGRPVNDATQHLKQQQQPVAGYSGESGGLRPEFIDDVRQSLHELRLGLRAANSYRRSQFLGPDASKTVWRTEAP